MLSIEFWFRLVGMVVLAIFGTRFGVSIATPPFSAELFALLFGLLGAMTGLILTPYFTTRPARYVRRRVLTTSAETLFSATIGAILGLILAALLAQPLAQLPPPIGQWLPSIAALFAAYVIITLFVARSADLVSLVARLTSRTPESVERVPATELLLDTSVIIDGRILDISRTGFIPGTMLVPRFILSELQHIADSSDPLKRMRGRRGLEVLDELQREERIPVRMIDDDVPGVRAVDDKLVLVAQKLHAQLMTNDFNLNSIAKLQGVSVLNVNELANAVKAVFLPNEQMNIRVIQEGREPDQGVGYLADGTMVVVENGKLYLDRTIEVVVTRMIQTAAGKMYFAKPLNP